MQTTNLRLLVEVPLRLEFLLTDAVRFIPVKFCPPNRAIRQSDASDPLHLPPSATPVQASKARPLANAVTGGNGLDVRKVTEDLEVHRTAILGCPCSASGPHNTALSCGAVRATASTKRRLQACP